ncbi:MAG: choice-of-anchor J domain-containing protein [Bacteroidales bacterium]|nr:choice-of-anchor J domain-containing protein [Bacteroidales bacterium]
MKKKTLLIMMLVALFVPLALNAQNGLKKSMRSTKPLQKEIAQFNPSNDKGDRAVQKDIARVAPSNDRGDRGTSTVTASRITSATATWTGSAGETWNVAITGGTLNQAVTNGYAQYGQRNGASSRGTFSTSGIPGTITSVAVDCASYQGNGTVSVTVGGAAFGGSQSIPSWTNNAGGTRTFTGSASGAIVVTMTNANNGRAMYIKSITVTYSACGAPENLTVSNSTPTSATVTWEGDASSYNLQYRELAEETVYFSDDFESGSFDDKGWTTIRNGQGTEYTDWRVINGQTAFSDGAMDAHSGVYMAMTRSWSSNAYGVDNWLITPQVTLDGTLTFWVEDDGQYHETFYVYVSTRTNAIDDFTLLSSPGNATDAWGEVTVDLSSYNGAQGYIAIRHQDYDKDYLFMDDFKIAKITGTVGSWSDIISVNGNSYTIEGLSEGVGYEVQVQGVCDGQGQSNWVNATFTTPSYCEMVPTDLAVELSDNSAELSWTGFQDSYNVQYRIPAFDGYYINEPLTPDNIGDWGAYLVDDNSGFYYTDDTNSDVCWAFYYNTNPPQYLFSPDFPRPTQQAVTLTFDYKVRSADYPETFEVLYFVGDDLVEEEPVTVTNTDWEQYTSQVPVGATGFVIAYLSNDMYVLYLDNFVISSDEPVTEGTDWVSVTSDGNTFSLAFSELESESVYEWQVQGIDCDGEGANTNWSYSEFFSTPEIPDVFVESISADDVEVLVDATFTITPTVLPAEANQVVTYESADETIATVDENGVVTGVAYGTTTITIAATDGSGVTTTINVNVTRIDVTEITAEDVTMVNGETAIISYAVTPDNATDASVTFTSADETIATVDENGIVSGMSAGETTITIASVSNPEVSTTINVTVTSNPDAVQFTVSAPENAQPGDVITVEAYLNAPTSGNYNGFTGLVLGLHFNTAAFAVNGNPVNGPVASACMMTMPGLPNETHPDLVQLSCVMTPGNPNTTTGLVFSMQFTVLEEVEFGSYTFYAEPISAINFVYNPGSAAIQIPYENVPSTVVIAEVEQYIKHIDPYTTDGGYYLIASPIGEVSPEDVTNMLSNSYDLYYFDQSQDLEWINYKGDDGGYNLVPGKGYLYANSGVDQEGIDLIFTGTAYSGDADVKLDYDETATLAGWNLVGNPFVDTVYLADNRPFYTVNGDGSEIISAERTYIEAMEGVFVIAEAAGETLTFTTTEPTGKNAQLVLNVTSNRSNVIDRVIVRFGEGHDLPKFQLNPNHTKLYMPKDNKDYAVVNATEMGEMPVNFKAENNGNYTLSFSNQEVEFSYLHLIDNLTGADVDLLANPSYNFEAKTTDYASRFKLAFATGNSTNVNEFGFISDNHLKIFGIEGNATLKVMDITGRTLSTENFSGSYDKQLNLSAGVYMLQLIQGNDVKTQKIVIR